MKKIVAMMMVLALCMGCALAEMTMDVSFMAQGIEGELVDFVEYDFDGDGANEAFAVITPDGKDMSDVYFFNGEEAVNMLSEIDCQGLEIAGQTAPYHVVVNLNPEQGAGKHIYVGGGKASFNWMHELEATGDVKVRKLADKESDILGYLEKGDRVMYLYEIETDARGVDWYRVKFEGKWGWVSSRYSAPVLK